VHKVALLEKALEMACEQLNKKTGLLVSTSDWIKHAEQAVAGTDTWRLKEPIKYPSWLEG